MNDEELAKRLAGLARPVELGVNSTSQSQIDDLAQSFRREAAQRATQWKKLGVKTSGWNSGADQCGHERVAGFVLAPGSRKRFDEIVQKTGSDRLTLERLVTKSMYQDLFGEHVRKHAKARLLGNTRD